MSFKSIEEDTEDYILNDICSYSKEKISINKINNKNYISTENMLANKGGITEASTLPNTKNVIGYCEGDILISNIRPYFKKIWFADKEGGVSNDVLVVRANTEKVLKEYLYYFLSQEKFFDYIMGTSKGTKMPRGDKEAIMKYKISLPSLYEQKIIANIFSTLDEKIEVNNQMNKKLEEMAQTIFKRWFVDLEFPDENGKPYKSSGGEMIESEIGMIPKRWKLIEMGKIADIQNGFAFKASEYVENGIKVMRTLNINDDGYFTNENIVYLPDVYKNEKYDKYILKKFDINLVMVGTNIGKTGIILKNVENSLQNQNMWRFRTKSNDIPQLFLNYKVKEAQKISQNWGTGSAREFYRKDSFSKIKVLVGDSVILHNFNEIILPMFEQISIMQCENEKLKRIRDTLLPKLMSGEIRV